MSHQEPKVRYEAVFRASKASFARFGEALVRHGARLVDSYVLDEGDVAVVLVQIEPSKASAFFAVAKFFQVIYYPPRVFDNGTLVGMFDSPEDEVAGRLSEAAKRIKEQERIDGI